MRHYGSAGRIDRMLMSDPTLHTPVQHLMYAALTGAAAEHDVLSAV